MFSEPIFLRWEHTTNPHHKFYEVELELSLFCPKLLIRRRGRIGTRRPRSIRMVVADRADLQRQVGLIRRRVQHGYRLAQELEAAAIEVVAASGALDGGGAALDPGPG